VNSLSINMTGKIQTSDGAQQVLLDAAQRRLQLSLQHAAAAAAAESTVGQLRLSSFSSNFLASPAVLTALPSARW
jgi:hypothetical protein